MPAHPSLSVARTAGLLLTIASLPCSAAGLLDKLAPVRADAVAAPERLTDGAWEAEGESWQSNGAVHVPAGAFIDWDLGTVREVIGISLQGDNNDQYVVWLSDDGQTFAPVWRTGSGVDPGLRTRQTDGLGARGRYVRLTAEQGDGLYSVSELTLHSSRAHAALGWLQRRLPAMPSHPLDRWWTFGLLATALALAFTSTRSRPQLVSAIGLALIGLLGAVVLKTVVAVPAVDPARLDWMRAMVAAIAFSAVAREALSRRRPAHRGLVLGVLAASAGLGLLCFGNLGRPQFHDQGTGRPTYLHHYDMRTYFPIARYFPELRFDGVYVASAMAVADDRGGLDALADTRLRDLRTIEGTTIGAVKDHVLEVRARFSPERWAQFTQDMRYFRAAMGEGNFLGSMGDHGGNATPVWFLAARAAFGGLRASDTALWVGVILDVLLMALAFASLGWAFGPRTALIAMTVFGAMDFYMFGSNWFGAALRHDWLALWCIGLAALKKERFALAGGLLAWAALIRAFPAITFVTLTVPAAWDLLGAVRRRPFSFRAWFEKHHGLFRVTLGAAVTVAVLVGISVAVFGLDAWPQWFHKVSELNAKNHVNNLALRTHLSPNFAVWVALAVPCALLVAFAARRAAPFEAAAWGVALVPIVFNPANYYLHSAFMLVVLADEQRGASARTRAVWLALLAMCFASYFTTLTRKTSIHFLLDTVVLMVTLVGVWVAKVVGSWRTAPVSASVPPAPVVLSLDRDQELRPPG